MNEHWLSPGGHAIGVYIGRTKCPGTAFELIRQLGAQLTAWEDIDRGRPSGSRLYQTTCPRNAVRLWHVKYRWVVSWIHAAVRRPYHYARRRPQPSERTVSQRKNRSAVLRVCRLSKSIVCVSDILRCCNVWSVCHALSAFCHCYVTSGFWLYLAQEQRDMDSDVSLFLVPFCGTHLAPTMPDPPLTMTQFYAFLLFCRAYETLP